MNFGLRERRRTRQIFSEIHASGAWGSPESASGPGSTRERAASFLPDLIALTRELAAKWGPHGIRVNAIAPGFFPSRMTEKVLERMQSGIEQSIPMGRIGRPGELKGAAVFLVSEAASYITGQTLAIDGGTTVW